MKKQLLSLMIFTCAFTSLSAQAISISFTHSTKWQKCPNGIVVLPSTYSSAKGNASPALTITNVPKKARSLAVIMYDKTEGNNTQWVMWDISPQTTTLPARIPHAKTVKGIGYQGAESANGGIGYTGPWLPPNKNHQYNFIVYALNQPIGALDQQDEKQCPHVDTHKNHCIISSPYQFEKMATAKKVATLARSKPLISYYPDCVSKVAFSI